MTGAEQARLAASEQPDADWRRWGPYLSGRQWGTVREDYSDNGDAWRSFPFDHAVARAYRWGEDGIAGISDLHGFLNFSVAMWNGKDPILKERYFGLANHEGNHGEDAKEYWWIIDGTPTHSWMHLLYRYPQAEFPYGKLRELAAAATRDDREPELEDTGVLDEDRFFDIDVRYAKTGPEDICITISATNHGPDAAPLHLVPQLWFRNTWSWGRDARKPALIGSSVDNQHQIITEHAHLGRHVLHASGAPKLLVADNETNEVFLYGKAANETRYAKDGINNFIVDGVTTDAQLVKPGGASLPGTKSAFWYEFDSVAPGETVSVELRLTAGEGHDDPFGPTFAETTQQRNDESDEFYADLAPTAPEAERAVLRRAFAGLLWTKQHYRFRVREWLEGDPSQPAAPGSRRNPQARNAEWRHLDVADVISMPDEWEYPWFAAWDLACQAVPFAAVDPAFAKEQVLLLCREWLMHPNGQIPGYEWEFSDVNPPIHAWAALEIYREELARTGRGDTKFLAKVFHKLLLNFSWWVNRKDADDNDLFGGGFLGMDNIGPVNRSAPLENGWQLEQSDATSWMATYSLHLLHIALELARTDDVYEDVATKFVQHFLAIAHSSTRFGFAGQGIWDEEDGFCYDHATRVHDDGSVESVAVKVRSMVGLVPLFAAEVLESWVFTELPLFTQRLDHVLRRHPEYAPFVTWQDTPDGGRRALLSLLDGTKLTKVLPRMFNEDEFLSPHGIRSLSAEHRDGLEVDIAGAGYRIGYEPGESHTDMFGGNSNWRGPVWFPMNALLIQALQTLDSFHGKDFQIEVPAGSGHKVTAGGAADELSRRLVALFLADEDGKRPADGDRIENSASPLWQEHVTFNEYFDGDTGEGLGANHQTGWTAMVAMLIKDSDQRQD